MQPISESNFRTFLDILTGTLASIYKGEYLITEELEFVSQQNIDHVVEEKMGTIVSKNGQNVLELKAVNPVDINRITGSDYILSPAFRLITAKEYYGKQGKHSNTVIAAEDLGIKKTDTDELEIEGIKYDAEQGYIVTETYRLIHNAEDISLGRILGKNKLATNTITKCEPFLNKYSTETLNSLTLESFANNIAPDLANIGDWHVFFSLADLKSGRYVPRINRIGSDEFVGIMGPSAHIGNFFELYIPQTHGRKGDCVVFSEFSELREYAEHRHKVIVPKPEEIIASVQKATGFDYRNALSQKLFSLGAIHAYDTSESKKSKPDEFIYSHRN